MFRRKISPLSSGPKSKLSKKLAEVGCRVRLQQLIQSHKITKHHTMYYTGKVVLLLNYATLQEDVLGSGGITPYIFNPRNRWRRVVSVTSQIL
jgi:hypothetical protein